MNRIQNMLLGIAMGDAFGAGYEFAFSTLKEYTHNLERTQYKAP